MKRAYTPEPGHEFLTWQVDQALGITPRHRLNYCKLLSEHPIAREQFHWHKGQQFWTQQQVRALLYLRSLFHPPQGGRRTKSEVIAILNRGLPR